MAAEGLVLWALIGRSRSDDWRDTADRVRKYVKQQTDHLDPRDRCAVLDDIGNWADGEVIRLCDEIERSDG